MRVPGQLDRTVHGALRRAGEGPEYFQGIPHLKEVQRTGSIIAGSEITACLSAGMLCPEGSRRPGSKQVLLLEPCTSQVQRQELTA